MGNELSPGLPGVAPWGHGPELPAGTGELRRRPLAAREEGAHRQFRDWCLPGSHVDLGYYIWDAATALSASPPQRRLQGQECPICRQGAGRATLVVLGCGQHRFCAHCICSYVAARNELNAEAKCPEPSCKHVLSVPEVESICSKAKQTDVGKRYSFLHQQRFQHSAPADCCPRCHEAARLLPSERGPVVACRRCEMQFCTSCKEQAHPKVSCAEFAELRLQQAEMQGKRLGPQQELLTRQYLLERTRPCPCCGIAVTKDWACNAVICGRCRTKFCYSCLMIGDGHKHHRCQRKTNRELSRRVRELLDPSADERPAPEAAHGGGRCAACRAGVRGRRYECVNCQDFCLCNDCWISGKPASGVFWNWLFLPSYSKHTRDHVFRAVD